MQKSATTTCYTQHSVQMFADPPAHRSNLWLHSASTTHPADVTRRRHPLTSRSAARCGSKQHGRRDVRQVRSSLCCCCWRYGDTLFTVWVCLLGCFRHSFFFFPPLVNNVRRYVLRWKVASRTLLAGALATVSTDTASPRLCWRVSAVFLNGLQWNDKHIIRQIKNKESSMKFACVVQTD